MLVLSRVLDFLGHIISKMGIEKDPKKADATNSCSSSLSPSNIRSFLGLASFYKVFF